MTLRLPRSLLPCEVSHRVVLCILRNRNIPQAPIHEANCRRIPKDCNLDSLCRGNLETLKTDRGWKMDERGERIFF